MNRICFAFSNFSFFKNNREQKDVTIFNNLFTSYDEDMQNYASKLEFCEETESNT